MPKVPELKFLADEDFGELAIRFKRKINGVILLRFDPDKKVLRKKKVLELFNKIAGKLEGHLIIIDEQKIRFRKIF